MPDPNSVILQEQPPRLPLKSFFTKSKKGVDKSDAPCYNIKVRNTAPWPSGKARVCKTLIPGPNPGGASKKKNAHATAWAFLFLDTSCGFGRPKATHVASGWRLQKGKCSRNGVGVFVFGHIVRIRTTESHACGVRVAPPTRVDKKDANRHFRARE